MEPENYIPTNKPALQPAESSDLFLVDFRTLYVYGISDIHRGVAKVFALLDVYAAFVGSCFLTFRDRVSVQYQGLSSLLGLFDPEDR